jgi:hypothetical protein
MEEEYMRRFVLVAFVSAFVAVPAMASLSWNYNYVDSASHDLSSPYTSLPGFTVDTFNSGTTLASWTYGGDYIIGNAGSWAAAPYDAIGPSTGFDTTKFLAVPKPGSNYGANTGLPYIATVNFGGGEYRYLGLHWGSMDSYNEIGFFLGGVEQGVLTGNQVRGDGDGNQTDALSNRYVNIFTDFNFDSIELRSYDTTVGIAPYAFELDNLTVAVPAPGALLLCLIGLGAARLKLRKVA